MTELVEQCKTRRKRVEKTSSGRIRKKKILFNFLPMKMEQIECSETSAYKMQTPGSHPEENIQHTENGESLKSKKSSLSLKKQKNEKT
jgi:hypothetical protein